MTDCFRYTRIIKDSYILLNNFGTDCTSSNKNAPLWNVLNSCYIIQVEHFRPKSWCSPLNAEVLIVVITIVAIVQG